MNKLRRKMVRIVFIAVLSVFVLMSAMISTAVLVYNTRLADRMTEMICENNGKMPEYHKRTRISLTTENTEKSIDGRDSAFYPSIYNEESAFRTRYFVVYLEDAAVQSSNVEHIAAVDEEEAGEMARQVLEGGRSVGYVDEFRYRLNRDGEQELIVFVDCSENLHLFRLVGMMTVLVSAFFTMAITVIFAVLSRKVVEPFEENSIRQKQFITDASHELKTPLAIISANAEVLEYKNGKNDWTKNIIDQTKHMSTLINQLLLLAKMEEVGEKVVTERFDMGQLVEEKVQPFREMAGQRQADLNVELPKELIINANREQIGQLVSILTENAVKYVKESGEIRILLRKTGRNAVLQVYNTAELDLEKDYSRLFDRFYRTDKSRSSQTGGHGIGLSIAKKIVTQQGGKISALPQEQGICFKAELPLNHRKHG